MLVAVFLLGMWITWPEFPYNPSGFPINRVFVAVSVNGESVVPKGPVNAATFEVRRNSSLGLWAGGYSLCNSWGGRIVLLPGKRIMWGKVLQTAKLCPSVAGLEGRLVAALHGATRWRTEDGILILENGTDVLRLILAPQ